MNKGVSIDDVKCFDQFINPQIFLDSCKDNEEFCNLLAHQKWMKYFQNSKNVDCHSEHPEIAQFFFVVPSHSANIERIFSLMQVQLTKERNNLNLLKPSGNFTYDQL
jgi:hypothetical protein